MTKKDKAAKVIRIITIPPVLVTILLMLLYFLRDDIFTGVLDLLLSIIFLAVISIIGYPISALVPKEKRRETQRKLAFIFSFAGYLGAMIYGLTASVSTGLLMI